MKCKHHVPLLLFVSLLIPISFGHVPSVEGQWADVDWLAVVSSINRTSIESHVKALSSFPSRITGYPGAEAAAVYIEKTLKSYGLNTYTENYFITTPIDMGANITVLSPAGTSTRVLQAFPLWPNVVNPSPYSSPPGGDVMVYGGYSDFSDYAALARLNLTVAGKVVLVEFNSRWYWKNAVMLGAKAVVFIAPDETFRPQAEQKTMSIPLNFPRLYVNREEGLLLKELLLSEGTVRVKLSSSMKWVRKPSVNVIATLEGADPVMKREIVTVTAYYDTWSPVPSIAPGATDALNPAFLLEFARVITQSSSFSKPKRTVMFIAFSGHYQGIWGAREFIDAHFTDVGTKIRLFLSLDLATESKQVALYFTGTTYSYSLTSALQAKYYWARDAVFSRYQRSIEKALGRTYQTLDGIIVVQPPYEMPPLVFESDAFTLTNYGGGLAFHTTNSIRVWQKTPLDTPERLKMENLWPQVEFITAVWYAMLHDPTISSFLTLVPTKLATDWGFATVTGQVANYNATSAWFDPVVVKDAVVRVVQMSAPLAIPGVMSQGVPQTASSASGVGFATPYPGAPLSAIDIVMLPDENGVVKLKGAKPFTSGLMQVYVVNSTNGHIEQAMDMGVYGYRDQYSPLAPAPTTPMFYVYRSEVFRYLPLYQASSIALLNVMNPATLMPVPEGAVEIYNFNSHGWQIYHAQDVFWPEIMVYFEPGTPTEIVIRTGEKSTSAGFYYPLVILNNATSSAPRGSGYVLQPGETLTLTPFTIVNDLFMFNDYRVSLLHRYNTFDPRVDGFYAGLVSSRDRMETSLEMADYEAAYFSAMNSWVYDKMTYASSMDVIIDVVLVTVFFFFLLIPFSFLLERLLGAFSGMRRILFTASLFIAVVVLLSLVHPGFHIATNVPMVLISLAVILIAIPVTGFIVGEAQQVAKELRSRTIGLHFAEISRVSALLMAFSVGIQNMKKRRFRTILMVTSITLTSFCLIALTSVSSISVIRTYDRTVGQLPYEGYLVRLIPWMPIPEPMLLSIKSNYTTVDAVVSPRAWIHPPRQELEVAPGVLVKAILCMTPQEANVSPVLDLLKDGRWFTESDYKHVIVSEALASSIAKATGKSFSVGSVLSFYGLDLTVVGLTDGPKLWDGKQGMTDLDGESLSPMDTMAAAQEGATGAATVVPHLVGDYVIFIPYKFALEAMNAQPISIAVKLPQSRVVADASAFAQTVLTDVFAGITVLESGHITIYRPRLGYAFTGTTMLIVPLAIAAFTVFNMMLGAVYERVKEIGVYTSVGLAPLHIASMFFSESVLYAVISSLSGYLMGIYGIAVLNVFKLLPEGFYPNFSSSFVVIALGVSALTVIASTAYPARVASRLSTPYMERKVRITKPVGDEWNIPLPFLAAEEEVNGVLFFMKEYLDAHSIEGVGKFIAKGTSLSEESSEGATTYRLSSEVWLAPLDAGITQDIQLIAFSPRAHERFSFQTYAKRKTGFYSAWVNSNRTFTEDIRTQLLIWRTLKIEEKVRYVERAKAQLPLKE